MNTDGTDYNAYADYGAYQTEIAKDAPVIEYYGSGSLAPGTVNVADYVKAHDYNGQELAVKLLKFCDKDGNELTDQMDQASGTITFSSAGKYSFTVKAVDSGNRKNNRSDPCSGHVERGTNEINHQGDCHNLYCRSDFFNDHGGIGKNEPEHGIKK